MFGSQTNLLQKQHTLKQVPKLHSMIFCRNKYHKKYDCMPLQSLPRLTKAIKLANQQSCSICLAAFPYMITCKLSHLKY